MADEKEKGGLMALVMGDKGSPKPGGGEFDSEARMLKSALDDGNGRRAYEVVKGWVEKCLSEKGISGEDAEPEEY